MLETAKKHRLNFDLLKDEKNSIAKQYGLVFTVPGNLKSICLSSGIDLEQCNGDNIGELPMPGRVAIEDQGSVARNREAAPDLHHKA